MATGGGDFTSPVGEIDNSVRIPTPTSKGYGDDKTETQEPRSESDKDSRTAGSSDPQSPRSPDDVKELERKFRYLKFQDYDFSKDEQFQMGWKKLSGVVPADQFDQQFLKAKLFYYSKHIEPLDINDYLSWKETRSYKAGITEQVPSSKQNVQVHHKGDNSWNSNDPASPGTCSDGASLSFSDVIELIQSGKPIPGMKTLDIKPTDSDPSPSVMERKTKPWESSGK